MKKAIITILVLLLFASQAEAYYIPPEHMSEAKQVKGTIGWYNFFTSHWTDGKPSGWAYDGLRQMAMQETNSGRIAELHVVIKKYRR